MDAKLRATMPLVEIGSLWLHRKGGLYIIEAVGWIEADLTPCVVYRSFGEAGSWVRPAAEFLDGRFEPADGPEPAPDDKSPASSTPTDNSVA